MRTAMDLEHSFGPAYARGFLLRGPNASAVIGVNAGESQATIDGILTLGILWLDHCRTAWRCPPPLPVAQSHRASRSSGTHPLPHGRAQPRPRAMAALRTR